MSHVWNLLNTLQIVNTFPLYSLQTPENVKQILVATNDIAQMKMIDKEKAYEFVEDWLGIKIKKKAETKQERTSVSTAEVFADDLQQQNQLE